MAFYRKNVQKSFKDIKRQLKDSSSKHLFVKICKNLAEDSLQPNTRNGVQYMIDTK